MEKSVMNSAGSSVKNGEYSPAEESTWTFYLEEFLLDNDHESTCYNEDIGSINNYKPTDSDVSMMKKVQNGFCLNNNYKKLSFKKRKTAIVDDDLEDTASSPVNSPKVGYFSDHTSDINAKDKEIMNISEEKGRFGINGGVNIGEYSELKKRGLCLVPVSSLANYFP